MNAKTIGWGIAGAIITFVLLFFVYKVISGPAKTEFPEINQVRTSDHPKWSKENKNILVEYSDLQCPACKSFHETLKAFESSSSPDFSITQKVTMIYRHYPLYQIHKNAIIAAYADESAGIQGKFWEMQDLLFEKQSEWSVLSDPKDFFANLAKELKLDSEKFKKDMDSEAVKNIVQSDMSEGDRIKVNSTPTFFLNGKKLDQIRSIDEFKNLLKSL